jgi:predicted RNA-binding protein with PUA-like domain
MKSAPKTSANQWLVKSEPESYSWADLVRDGRTDWTGVRNFAARNHLNAMQPGDRVLFYESGGPKAVVGVAEVSRAAFPDTTADEPGWVAIELKAVQPLAQPVTLAQIKADPALAKMALVRIGRLSVQPVTAAEYARIEKLGG